MNNNPKCPICSGPTSKSGKTGAGSQRYRCNAKACRKTFTPNAKKRVYESSEGEAKTSKKRSAEYYHSLTPEQKKEYNRRREQSRKKKRSPAKNPKTAGEVMQRFFEQIEGDSSV